MSKRDIDGAFKRVWWDPKDVGLFATDIEAKVILEKAYGEACADNEVREDVIRELGSRPGKAGFADLFRKFVNTLLVSEIGYSGSPGRFGRFGEGAERAVERQAPADGRRNGSEFFFLCTWADDGLSVEGFLYWILESLSRVTGV